MEIWFRSSVDGSTPPDGVDRSFGDGNEHLRIDGETLRQGEQVLISNEPDSQAEEFASHDVPSDELT